MTVKVGDKFDYQYADSSPTWEVIEKRGRGTWLCRIVGNDYGDVTNAFTTEVIDERKRYREVMDSMDDDHMKFYAGLPLGGIVHYDSGFNQFVRCEVVRCKLSVHGRALVAIALVGNWSEHDLPRRMADGSIYNGYHAQSIIDRKPFEPNYSNIYEARDDEGGMMLRSRSATIDPRNLPPVSLAVPDMSDSEKNDADLVCLVSEVAALCADPVWDSRARIKTPKEKLRLIAKLLQTDRAVAHLA